MALVYNEKATVATGMSPIVQDGLYSDDIFIDDMTFTSEHNVANTGQVQVVVYEGGRGVKPAKPVGHFTHEDYENTVININLTNSFRKSVEVHGIYSETMPRNVFMDESYRVSRKVAGGRQESALAALVDQGSVSEDTTTITSSNVKDIILQHLEILDENNAKPDVIICSVPVYYAMLAAAGKEFTPLFNEDVLRNGKIGQWLGVNWIKSSLIGNSKITDLEYLDDSFTKKTIDGSDIDFIIYDHMSYSILDKLITLRAKDATDFVGSYVQAEINSAFKVTNKNCTIIKKK